MDKQLNEFTKEELIDIIQDYQEMVSEIENTLTESFIDSDFSSDKFLEIREIMDKWLHGKYTD